MLTLIAAPLRYGRRTCAAIFTTAPFNYMCYAGHVSQPILFLALLFRFDGNWPVAPQHFVKLRRLTADSTTRLVVFARGSYAWDAQAVPQRLVLFCSFIVVVLSLLVTVQERSWCGDCDRVTSRCYDTN